MNEKMKQWWCALANREKKIVIIGSVFLAIIISYQWIVSPYLEKIKTMRQRVQSAQKTWQWMQAMDQAIRQIDQSAAVAKPVSPVILMNLLKKDIAQVGLLDEMKQVSADSVQIRLHQVNFDRWVRVVVSLMSAYPIIVTQLAVIAEEAPGMVTIEMVVKV